jgi:MFS family permease
MAPLRHPAFRLLVAGQLVSNFGDGIYAVALPWYVLAHHGGALLLGTVLAAYGVPRTALLVVGGHASDRYRPWTVMLGANVARGIAVTAFAVTAASGLAHGSVLIVIAVVLGAGEGMFIPASSAIVPALLPRDQLQAGNALSFGTTQLSQLAGPALGGVLVALVGPATGFAIDAATFAVSALTLIGIQRDTPQPAPTDQRKHPNEAQSMVTARGLLAREPILILMLITDALLNLGSAGMGRVALPALAKGPLHLGAGGYGALSAGMGAGLLIGTISGSWLPSPRRPLLVSADRGDPLRGWVGSSGDPLGPRLYLHRDRQPAGRDRAAAMGAAPPARSRHGSADARQRRHAPSVRAARRCPDSAHRTRRLLPARSRHRPDRRDHRAQLTSLAAI